MVQDQPLVSREDMDIGKAAPYFFGSAGMVLAAALALHHTRRPESVEEVPAVRDRYL